MKNSKVIFDKQYSDESMIDLPEDIQYLMDMDDIEQDKNGFYHGTFHVVITWSPDEFDEE